MAASSEVATDDEEAFSFEQRMKRLQFFFSKDPSHPNFKSCIRPPSCPKPYISSGLPSDPHQVPDGSSTWYMPEDHLPLLQRLVGYPDFAAITSSKSCQREGWLEVQYQPFTDTYDTGEIEVVDAHRHPGDGKFYAMVYQAIAAIRYAHSRGVQLNLRQINTIQIDYEGYHLYFYPVLAPANFAPGDDLTELVCIFLNMWGVEDDFDPGEVYDRCPSAFMYNQRKIIRRYLQAMLDSSVVTEDDPIRLAFQLMLEVIDEE